jgi:hypothetical protein
LLFSHFSCKIDNITTIGEKMEQFIDTLAEHITGAMIQEIAEELFDQWSNNNLEQGEDYAENMFMQYASPELKQQYNEYYGYIEGDDFLL